VELLSLVGLTAGLLAAPIFAQPAPTTPAESLAKRIEDHHRNVNDLTARFTQTYRSGILGREVVERGTVSIKPPGKMLWEYKDPEKKTFVSDGKTFYFYVPSDKQVVVRDQAGDRGLLGRLLSGRGGMLAQFDVGLESAPSGKPRLQLVPKKADPDVDRVYIEPDDGDRIQVIEIIDTQGNRSRFRFDGIRENVGLSEQLFRFEIPKGVEVIAG
jgi:outer membrane lipoprotein carrier protein